jgi:hypothetical protein
MPEDAMFREIISAALKISTVGPAVVPVFSNSYLSTFYSLSFIRFNRCGKELGRSFSKLIGLNL